MPTPKADTGVGAAVRHVAEHASTLARLELELAALELKRKAASLGLGVGLLIGAAALGFFMLAFGLATVAAAIATALPAWAALLIVTAALGLLVCILGVLALGRIKKGTPPVPEQAIDEAKKTAAALRSANGHG